MKWYHYFICVVLIILGTFCTIELIDVFNVSSAEYGVPVTIETKNNYNEVFSHDYGDLSFDTEDELNYVNKETFSYTYFDGKNGDYTILFNGNLVDNVVVFPGKITGDLILNFYDLEGANSCKVTLNILIEFYAGGTTCTLSLVNQNNSIGYLSTYTSINGAVLKVVERSAYV